MIDLKKKKVKIFIYGTLKKYAQFSNLIRAGKIKRIGKGRIQAKLYDFGEYPGAVGGKGSYVYGEVYEIADIDRVLSLLDEYEEFNSTKPASSLFIRKTSKVLMEDGEETFAFTYFYNREIGKARVIPNGIWRGTK